MTLADHRARWPRYEWRTEPDGDFSATIQAGDARLIRTIGKHAARGSGVLVQVGGAFVRRTWFTPDAIDHAFAPDDEHLTWAADELQRGLDGVRRSRAVVR